MANDEIKFLPIFQILDIKNIWFLLDLEMALSTAIKKKFEPVWDVIYIFDKTHLTQNLSKLYHDKIWIKKDMDEP